MSKKTLAVIRGARENVITFYENFKKFEVRFISASFRPFKYTGKEKNFKFINLPFYKPLKLDPPGFFNQYGNLSWINIRDLEKNLSGCDTVNITDTYYFFNLQAVNWARKNRVPVVTIIWTTIPNHITSWFPPYSLITKKVVETTDLFILRSKTAFNFTDSLKIPRKKVRVIYKGVDLNEFKPSTFSHKSSVISILFTGNLSRAKGLDDLLSVYSRLRMRYRNLKLIIAGDGEMRNEVLKKAERGKVDFRGFVSYSKLAKIYQGADIYCAPSKERRFLGIKVWEEYFSYALMEALASGLPIVATKTGGIPEEVGNKNLLVEPGNREQLERSLEKLIVDVGFRQNLGRENRGRAEKFFDAKKQARVTEEAILKIL